MKEGNCKTHKGFIWGGKPLITLVSLIGQILEGRADFFLTVSNIYERFSEWPFRY